MTKDITVKEGEGAFEVHQTILALKKTMGMAFVELGRLLKRIRDEGYYQVLGYDSFGSYVVNSELGFKRRTAYYYIEIYDWFIEKLGFTPDYIGAIGQDKLMRVLEILKEEFSQSEKYPFNMLKERAESLMTEAEELRPVDFEKKHHDEKKQEGHKNYLAPPEYFRCEKCGKWKIVVPVDECCPDWILEFRNTIEKKYGNKK